MERKRGSRRVLTGFVVSDKMDKTVVVEVSRLVLHRMYHKYVKRQKKYKVHDPRNEYRVGDKLQIVEARPVSKEKCWRVQKLLERPQVA